LAIDFCALPGVIASTGNGERLDEAEVARADDRLPSRPYGSGNADLALMTACC